MKRYIVIHEKLCQEAGHFSTYVFSKSIPGFSPQDSKVMNSFECTGWEQEFRHIEIDLKTGHVVVMRPTVSSFPGGVQVFTQNNDKQEETTVIDSDA